MSMLIALALIAAAQAAPLAGAAVQAPNTNGTAGSAEQARDPLAGKIDQALEFIKGGKPAEAVAVLDAVIAAEESRYQDDKRLIFSARSMTETILYAGIGASQKKSAIVLDDTWSLAYFLKGFALIDLNRADDAKAYFDRALALAPMNAQYLAERAEWFKSRKDWANAYTDFEAASSAAEFSPDDAKSFEQRRAWRGMAYARTEQGRLKEARELLQKCLKLDASDDKCQHELRYVNSLPGQSN